MVNWHARYRRIIDAYRSKLMEVDPNSCRRIDDQLWDAKEEWVSDDRPIEPGKLMTAKEIALQFGIDVHNIRAWARRHPEKIKTHKEGGKVLFLLREILAYHAEL